MTVTDGSSRANATSEALEFVTPYPPPSITSVQRVREQNGPPPAIELCWEEQRFDGTLANGYEIFVSTSRSHLQFERVMQCEDTSLEIPYTPGSDWHHFKASLGAPLTRLGRRHARGDVSAAVSPYVMAIDAA